MAGLTDVVQLDLATQSLREVNDYLHHPAGASRVTPMDEQVR